MTFYTRDLLAENALRHLDRAERHGRANETADAAQRLNNAADEGAKWYLANHHPTRREPARGAHEWRADMIADHAGDAETSAAASDACVFYNHSLGAEQPTPWLE